MYYTQFDYLINVTISRNRITQLPRMNSVACEVVACPVGCLNRQRLMCKTILTYMYIKNKID